MTPPTDTEVKVLIAYAKHGDMAAAGRELGMATQTVKNHLLSIRKKLGVKSSLQAYYLLVQGVKLVQATQTESTIKIEVEP